MVVFILNTSMLEMLLTMLGEIASKSSHLSYILISITETEQ